MIAAVDWVTISSLATAGATLVLALATFGSVRSANRAARAAERSLLAGIRPLLVPSRIDDPPQKVGFMDDRWFSLKGSGGIAEATDTAVYFAVSVRNSGSGIAVLDGWSLHLDPALGARDPTPTEEFTRLTRDLYVAGGELGFWQGALRDPAAPEFAAARTAVDEGRGIGIQILYGDQEGGQRAISYFSLTRRDDGAWFAAVARHWSLDGPAPR